MNTIVGLCTLLIPLVAGPAPAEIPQQHPVREAPVRATPNADEALRPLAVVGFRGDQKLDSRDAWMPLAIEETLAWRLRRVPTLTVIPATRTHRAQQELAEGEKAPAVTWPRVVRLLGAKLWLRGECAGTPQALTLNLELIRVDQPDAEPVAAQLGPGRLFDVMDQATRWALGRLGVPRIDTAIEEIVFGPPARSPSVLEYYAKALSAARNENLRDGAFYVGQALGYDPAFRPALLLTAKLGLRGPGAARLRPIVPLRRGKQLATDRGDLLDEAEFELTLGLLMMRDRSFDAACQTLESALGNATKRSDLYGQIAAHGCLCDLWLSHRPSTRADLPEDERRRLQEQDLRHAAESQLRVLDMLSRLGDVVAEVPAASKLALIYEKLGESAQALEMHQRTLAAAEQTGSKRNQATAWVLLGEWYHQHGRWQEALDATNRCLALAPQNAQPTVRIGLAEIYRDMSRPQEALDQYQAAYQALKDSHDQTSFANQFLCLRGIAQLRMELGQREGAISALQEALDIAQVHNLAEENSVREQLSQWKNTPP